MMNSNNNNNNNNEEINELDWSFQLALMTSIATD
jgi:hypothetical protein